MDRFTALVTMLQFVGGEYSTIIGVGLEFVWVAGWLVLAGLAYTLRSWRHLVLAYSAPSILSLGTVLEWRQMLVSMKFCVNFYNINILRRPPPPPKNLNSTAFSF